MKNRSHHNNGVPNSDPPDDWANGSWTVDCLCGVNFDDGEEMVNCDECGVWVHTRCSRYVKGDDIFVCDKCKTKNNRSNNNNNDDSEETEVAQLLMELPTKTVRIENNNCHHPGRNSAATRRPPPVRPWTEVPMEERVHIHGKPGGDPALFKDSPSSSIFSQQLWKSSGYMPKKFNFRYKEFPCWEEESESPVDKGAGVLFSLSKEGPLAEVGGGHDRRKISLKERKKWGCGSESKEGDSGSLQPVVAAQPLKRRTEDSVVSKDRSSRKRCSTAGEKEVDAKKRIGPHSSKTVFTPTSDAKHLAFYGDSAPKFLKGEVRSSKNKSLRETVVSNEAKSNCPIADPRRRSKEISSSVVAVEDCSVDKEPKEDHVGPRQAEVPESSSKINDSVCSTGDHGNAGKMDITEKGDGTSVSTHDCLEVSGKNVVKDISETVEAKAITAKDSNGDLPREPKLLNNSVKEENLDNNSGSVANVKSSPNRDANDHVMSSEYKSEAPKPNGIIATLSHSGDPKVEYIDQSLEAAASDSHVNKSEQFSNEHCLLKSELEVTEGLMALQRSPAAKLNSGLLEENPKLGGTVSSSQRKFLSCSVKSSLITGLIHKSSTEAQHPNPFAKPQNTHDNSNVNARKDRSSHNIRDENLRTVKDRPKSMSNPIPKPSSSGRVSHDSLPKKPTELKENLLSASAKTSSAANIASVTSGCGEHQKATHTNIRSSVSGLASSKGEKPNQSNIQAPTKINPNSVPSVCPPIPSGSQAALSDEELALLLHQELNSSPRVPRVPRARNAGNLPQLASPSATTLLKKRTSSSGGKDHSSAPPKRKYRDGPRDEFRSSRDGADEVKKTERVSSSHDPKRRDTEYFTEEGSTKREENGSSGMDSEKRNAPSTSAATISGPSSSNEANDRNVSSIRSSPKNASDDDTGAVGPVHRTLPGLINEIMSKGRRMTYEELCNAVLPHWQNLRKHNGERYAYSSHSQAVLDCLRNRHEWARLVDRGPKTNSSRKRRKTDAEDSEDNDMSKGKPAKPTESKSLESQKEDFPKGKRKARKRRRLALQGKGIKDIRKSRKQDDHRFTDEDFGTSSVSSDESSSSGDGNGLHLDGSEASTSSDDGDTI